MKDTQAANAESFVLAGGQSSRMGQDKARLPVTGAVTLVEAALHKLKSLGGPPPRIAGSRQDLCGYAEVVADRKPGCGPLSGIEAALAATTRPLILCLAVDLPLVPSGLLRWLLARAEITGALMTVPRLHGRPQPLCAVYHRELLRPATAALQAGNYKLMSVLSGAAPGTGERDVFDLERVVSACPEMLSYSSLPLHRWFHNCNTPEDMAAMGNVLVLSA